MDELALFASSLHVARQEMDLLLAQLRSVLSPHLYEDMHEILMTQVNKMLAMVEVDRWEAGIHHCDQLILQLHELFQAARAAHRAATGIVANASTGGARYCLFLRTFDTGRHIFGLSPLESERLLYWTAHFPHDYELQAMLIRNAPEGWDVVGVENLALISDSHWWQHLLREPTPMFLLGDDEWKPRAEQMIVDADAIVVYITSASEGVTWELDAIARNACAEKTLILTTASFLGRMPSLHGRAAHVVECGEEQFDLDHAAEVVRGLLISQSAERTARRGPEAEAADTFDFSASLPVEVRNRARRGIDRMRGMINLALRVTPRASLSLTAAAAQSMVVYGWLAWDMATVAEALCTFAAVQSHPEVRDRRSSRGRARAELAQDNLSRAREYASLGNRRADCDRWFSGVLAALTG
jgi:hypothetical protein